MLSGETKRYSLTASANVGWSTISNAPNKRHAYTAFLNEGLNDPDSPRRQSWALYAVKKGTGTHQFTCTVLEEHAKLTGTRQANSDFGSVGDKSRISISSAFAIFKLQG